MSNRLQSIALGAGGSRNLGYDAAGNVVSDNRGGAGYGYAYNAANRMESFAINGVVQAEYVYNALGQQVIRRVVQDSEVFHVVHDLEGNRLAEYQVDEVAGTSTLLREYVWFEGVPVAVVEGGAIYLVRTDHIGRPVFATDMSGAKVWEASYLPFGGVYVSTGENSDLRFPGQWFQSEAGLHQNWMRDYDPTTGRYIQADPLGLVDGASVYGYVVQNPARYVDPRGEYTLNDAYDSLEERGVPRDEYFYYSDTQAFDEWLRLERGDTAWINELKPCPCKIDDAKPSDWSARKPANQTYHPGGTWEIRSRSTKGGHGNQCIYDASGKLVTTPPAAGSADLYAPTIPFGVIRHFLHDVVPYNGAVDLGRVNDYFSVRPVVGEKCCSD